MKLKEDEPALVARLFGFLYTDDVPRTNLADDGTIVASGQFSSSQDPCKRCDLFQEIELYVKMYTLADKYLLNGLR